ncbi:MAG TPA: cytochrome P450 [Thermoleophilaceae bacterium]|nr:cytochrome P450 [Thermoleophilaceae bacterium]
MSATLVPAPTTNPLRRIAFDLGTERRARASGIPFPPGPIGFSLTRTRRFAQNPLPILLDCYERHGPVFSIRILHSPVVFMLGPEANHFITVSNAAKFRWRDGSMGDLIPLLGDGLLTIDGPYHRQSRKIMLPSFHRERIAQSAGTMVDEIERALTGWAPGQEIDLYHWTRALALRIAMRALLGFDPDRGEDLHAAEEFENALSFWGRDYLLQTLRGPFSPFSKMQRHRRRLDVLIYEEIGRRRTSGERREDLMSVLLEATDDTGEPLSDREIRDHLITLLFAGHDTTTSTVTFLFYELLRHQQELERVTAELDRTLEGRAPEAEQLVAGLPELEMAMDETLRLYPPAWVGPRRAVESFEFAGVGVPAGALVNYCSWASHRLPDVFPEPDAFQPQRFTADAKAVLAKGAYVPFGGGSRTCIGMRFGQLEIKTIATLVLQRFRLELDPGYRLDIRMMPTLSPKQGLPLRVLERRI